VATDANNKWYQYM